ncbi:MAG TPA: hypothetical protein VNG51_05980 [Ktedonobacteraceae bacterium]|nr:hypothetical protein [Ktedonobacteraceae bacterium]
MAKSGNAPTGYYSSTQVMRKLGIGSSTLQHFVKTGKIKRIVPPHMRDGYYAQEEVDKMAKEKELFLLTYSKDTTQFSKATEEDLVGIYEVGHDLWGNRTQSYEARLNSYLKNPFIYYVVKKQGIIVGYLGLIPFKKEARDKLLAEPQTHFYLTYEKMLKEPDEILTFIPREPIDSLSLEIAVKQGTPRGSLYGMRLIQGGLTVMEELAKQGTIIKKLDASSSSPDGIKICRDMGFTELPPLPDTTRLRFELDLETTTNPLIKNYQLLVKQAEPLK